MAYPAIPDWITEIIDEILDNLRGRKGIGDELDQIDNEVMQEIREELYEIIKRKVDE